jgi:hypothetical protein
LRGEPYFFQKKRNIHWAGGEPAMVLRYSKFIITHDILFRVQLYYKPCYLPLTYGCMHKDDV